MQHKISFKDINRVLPETIVLSVGVLFVLFVFQPFGTDDFEHPYKYLQLFGYGVLIFISYPLIKLGIAALLDQKVINGLLGELIIIVITSVFLVFLTFIYYSIYILGRFNWANLPSFALFAFAIFSPLFLLIMYDKWMKEQSKLKKEAEAKSEDIITLVGDNKGEDYLFNSQHLLYLQSEGNYVKILFLENGKKQNQVLIRSTLARLSKQLPTTNFVQSHRSYLVNKIHFSKLINQKGSYILQSPDCDLSVPVSKSFLDEVKRKWKDFS